MSEKKKILWISPYAPYDQVAHAGGKNHNFYIKHFQSKGRFEICLLSLCRENEKDKLDLDEYGIRHHIRVMDQGRLRTLKRYALGACSRFNPMDAYGGLHIHYERLELASLLKTYYKTEEKPDMVILQWTISLMLAEDVKKYFPHAKLICIEEDVFFLNYHRRWKNAKNALVRAYWKTHYKRLRAAELHMLSLADLVVTNNPKDTEILKKCGYPADKLFTSVVYFDNYSGVKRPHPCRSRDILFFGAMSREENYKSALWFIRHVMPLIEDLGCRFVVVGSNPPEVLQKKAGDQVEVTGFVDSVAPYFENCLCMASPLLGGAGIKVKILEALSAGVPVLTNQIGIEGIPAGDGREYYHCELAEDYEHRIRHLLADPEAEQTMSEAARTFIVSHYDLGRTLDQLIDIL